MLREDGEKFDDGAAFLFDITRVSKYARAQFIAVREGP
jgi:hypothetical protein